VHATVTSQTTGLPACHGMRVRVIVIVIVIINTGYYLHRFETCRNTLNNQTVLYAASCITSVGYYSLSMAGSSLILYSVSGRILWCLCRSIKQRPQQSYVDCGWVGAPDACRKPFQHKSPGTTQLCNEYRRSSTCGAMSMIIGDGR